MKRLPQFLLALFSIISLTATASVAELSLSARLKNVDKLHAEITKLQNGVSWDFSDVETDVKDQVSYKLYEDTLICEDINGFLYWYLEQNNNIFFIKKEDRLMSIIPTAKIKSAGFSPNERVLLDCQYRAPGKYCRIYDIEEYGRCISYPSVNGKLIYSSSDTINVNMTHERWMYNIKKSTNQTDSILSTYILGTDIYRWFYNDSKMPLAVYSYQTTVNGIENALAYRADDEYLKKGIQTTEENSEAVRDFYAEYRQGNLKLHIGAIQPITVSIEIVSDNGIPYGMHTQTLTEGSKELNIGVGSLRYGRYVCS